MPATPRIALWDNARLLLIALVVFGHLIEGLHRRGGADVVYTLVYAFHIPAFFLVSGWFARSAPLDRAALLGTARIVVTWLIAEGVWLLLRLAWGEPAIPGSFLVVPRWTLWFLVSLVAIRALLPYLALLRAPVLVAVAGSIVAGTVAFIGTEFSASRTIALLPFFVIGWWLRRAGVGDAVWFLAPTRPVRIAAGVAAAVLLGVVLLASQQPWYTDQIVFWRRPYARMGFDDASGALLRLVAIAVAVGLTAALLLLLPRRRFRVSAVGANTLAVYLLHAPIVDAMRRLHLDDAIGRLPLPVVVMAVLAAALTLLLGSGPVTRALRPVLHPDLLFAPVRDAPALAGAADRRAR